MNKQNRIIRHKSLRKRIVGTSDRPRLAVFRSSQHIYAQIIDDTKSVTLVSVSDLKLKGPKKDLAMQVGEEIAKKAQAQKITEVVFDRGGFGYHGRVEAVALGSRKGGLKF